MCAAALSIIGIFGILILLATQLPAASNTGPFGIVDRTSSATVIASGLDAEGNPATKQDTRPTPFSGGIAEISVNVPTNFASAGPLTVVARDRLLLTSGALATFAAPGGEAESRTIYEVTFDLIGARSVLFAEDAHVTEFNDGGTLDSLFELRRGSANGDLLEQRTTPATFSLDLPADRYFLRFNVSTQATGEDGVDSVRGNIQYSLNVTSASVPLPPAVWSGAAMLAAGAAVRVIRCARVRRALSIPR